MFYCEKNHNISDHKKLPAFDVCLYEWYGGSINLVVPTSPATENAHLNIHIFTNVNGKLLVSRERVLFSHSMFVNM